ncbi:MAG: strictosidine synthase [Burkholderiales bacterium PBB4]|nr:MAG: strictosidine synthase [Burkholderiales bacterium PBB4]
MTRVPTMKRWAFGLAGLVAVAAAYLLLWPTGLAPVRWDPPTSKGLVGPHAPNTRLSGTRSILLHSGLGPEHIAVAADGTIFTGTEGGQVLRLDPQGSAETVIANTGGRVLGMAIDAQGDLIVADAYKGLLRITPAGRVSVLSDRVDDGTPVGLADAVAIGPDGSIYFSDASTRFTATKSGGALAASRLEILEQSASGRVLVFDPRSGRTSEVARGLSFANGIVVTSDGRSLLVADTGRYRIWKIDAGARQLDLRHPQGKSALFIDNLPGFPDNLTHGREGRIWVGLVAPRTDAIDAAATMPTLRSIVARLPPAWIPAAPPHAHVIALSELDGRVVADLQDASGDLHSVTGVTETADRFYLHTLEGGRVHWLPSQLP